MGTSKVEPMEVEGGEQGESTPSCWDMQIDGCCIAPPILDKNLTCGQKARFRMAQVANVAIVVLGTYLTVDSFISAVGHFENEKINPSTSIGYNNVEEIEFPQIFVCTWGYVKADSIKCTLTQQLPSGEPLCYDADGNLEPYVGPQADPANELHWSQGTITGAPCYNSTSELAEAYDCTPDVVKYEQNHFNNEYETCFTINGPSAETATKIKTKGKLTYPFVAFHSGWQNEILLEFEHDMSEAVCVDCCGTASATVDNTECYFLQQLSGVYWDLLPTSRKVTTRDTENTPYLVEAGRYYMHSMSKTIVSNKDTKEDAEYWEPISSSMQTAPLSGAVMKYAMAFFYSDISVQAVTIKNNYNVINIIEAVGGSSGLLLGLSALHFLSWGMQLCGVRGWAEAPPDSKFPRTYL